VPASTPPRGCSALAPRTRAALEKTTSMAREPIFAGIPLPTGNRHVARADTTSADRR
jgi:hypothetical protein